MTLLRDRRGATALEMALVFPALLLVILGLVAGYDLIMCKRAMDVGVERALRYAVANSAGGSAGAASVYTSAASVISSAVGSRSTVTVSPSSYASGTKITVTATFAWAAPATLGDSFTNPIFGSVTLTSSAKMRVMH